MPEPTHKKRERAIAKLFGGVRNPLSGSMSRHTAGDVISGPFFIEQKHRKSHAIWTLFESVKKLAQKEKKIPVVTLTQHRKQGCLVVIHSADLEDFCRQWFDQHQ